MSEIRKSKIKFSPILFYLILKNVKYQFLLIVILKTNDEIDKILKITIKLLNTLIILRKLT